LQLWKYFFLKKSNPICGDPTANGALGARPAPEAIGIAYYDTSLNSNKCWPLLLPSENVVVGNKFF
jgi:hypothetical protein